MTAALVCRHCGERAVYLEPGAVYRLGELEVDTARDEVRVCGEAVETRPSERKILAALLSQPGVIFPFWDMLEACGISVSSARNGVMRLRPLIATAGVRIVCHWPGYSIRAE